MTAAKKIRTLDIDAFQEQYLGTKCQFHEGEVLEAQANIPDHTFLQTEMARLILNSVNTQRSPKDPAGWWISVEAAVKYGNNALFCHDLAGWQKSTYPQRPKRFPITERPDWVCEILSSNTTNDRITKKRVLHEHYVPYYWIIDLTGWSIDVMEWSEKGYTSVLDVIKDYVGPIPPFRSVNFTANLFFGEDEE